MIKTEDNIYRRMSKERLIKSLIVESVLFWLFVGYVVFGILIDYTGPRLQELTLGAFFLLCCSTIYAIAVAAGLFKYNRTYIKTNEHIIEYRRWPYEWHGAKWENTERIGKQKFLGREIAEVIFYRNQNLGPPLTERTMRQFRNRSGAVVLSAHKLRFQGWPNGPLADDIRKYAPHLFSEEAK